MNEILKNGTSKIHLTLDEFKREISDGNQNDFFDKISKIIDDLPTVPKEICSNSPILSSVISILSNHNNKRIQNNMLIALYYLYDYLVKNQEQLDNLVNLKREDIAKTSELYLTHSKNSYDDKLIQDYFHLWKSIIKMEYISIDEQFYLFDLLKSLNYDQIKMLVNAVKSTSEDINTRQSFEINDEELFDVTIYALSVNKKKEYIYMLANEMRNKGLFFPKGLIQSEQLTYIPSPFAFMICKMIDIED